MLTTLVLSPAAKTEKEPGLMQAQLMELVLASSANSWMQVTYNAVTFVCFFHIFKLIII
jgi:hypothetical protein